MNTDMKKTLLFLAALAVTFRVAAKVELPEIIGSDMMLQQNADARLWGWADPDAAVKIRTSWGEKVATRSDADGRWSVTVKTPAASFEPQRITVESGEKVTLDNVLIGEVWFAGGQSNMEMGLGGFWNCPVFRSNDCIARAGAQRHKIRYVKINRTMSMTPEERVTGKWVEFTPQTAPLCTAVGYFFAEMVSDVLGIPVGIIDCTWGGSRVEGWMDRETLESYTGPGAEDLSEEAMKAWPAESLQPLKMYNAMVHPLIGYTIRGFLWYQAESNIGGHEWYDRHFADMVALWRREWGQGEIPFYYVEIAPYQYCNGDLSARLREAQCRALDLIPNSGMISTNDLVEPYEEFNIHPANKHGVGYRLAGMALARTYGIPNIAWESPRYRSMEIIDGKAWITLSPTPMGYNRMQGIEGFEICGADRVFHPAQVAIGPDPDFKLIVSSPEVPEPVAVRYCFKEFQIGNLADIRGLPVIPFRTDDFPFVRP